MDPVTAVLGAVVAILTGWFGVLKVRDGNRISVLERQNNKQEERIGSLETKVEACEDERRLVTAALAEKSLEIIRVTSDHETKSRTARAQFDAVLEILSTGNTEALEATITTDSHGKILEWDTAATAIFGWTEEEATGQNAIIVIPHYLKHLHLKAFRKWQATDAVPRTDPIIGSAAVKGGTEIKVSVKLTAWKEENEWRLVAKIKRLTHETKHDSSKSDSGSFKRPPFSTG